MAQRTLAMFSALVVGSLLGATHAEAITLPDSSSCSATGANGCLMITNTAAALNSRAIYGFDSSGIGVIGETNSHIGVLASANTTGIGLYAEADQGNAIVAENTRTDMNAAVISALSGHSQNGLAYFGQGAIMITSSVAQKFGGGTWQVFSDARLKKDVNTLRSGLEELRDIRPVTYRYNGLGGTTNDGQVYVGVIAQELEKVLPSMVTSRKGKLLPNDDKETDIKIVDPNAFTYVLINAVKEQQQLIERQEHRIASLEHGRGGSLSASMLGGGIGLGLAIGLLPLGFVAVRRRQAAKTTA